MSLFHIIYNLVATAMALFLTPVYWCLAKRDSFRWTALRQRLGYPPDHAKKRLYGRPRVWIHAVSVGEVKAVEAVIRALDDNYRRVRILLTATTPAGYRFARRQLGCRASVRFAPLDLWGSTGRFLSLYRPDLLVCMETEIWPNWIVRAHRSGVPIAFVNGRISPRSIRSYMAIRPLIRPVLEMVAGYSMISASDARRIIALGAPAHRVQVNGNVKMDLHADGRDRCTIDRLRHLLDIEEETPVLVAGSVRGTEAEMILDVYNALSANVPGLLLIIAPRHIQNAPRIAALAKNKGISWQCRSRLDIHHTRRWAPLIILDTIGELRHVYALASVVFCGGSLVPMGGQNLLEPAMWAKPVLYGPSMEDFEEAKRLLESEGGGICVADAGELLQRALYLLMHVDEAQRIGHLAARAVNANQGAADRHAAVIDRLLAANAR